MSLPKYNELNTCHFVTSKVWQNIWLFKEEKYCQIIVENLNFYRQKFNFKLIAYNILPWHLHLILLLSEKWNDISKVMQQFKSHIARKIIDDLKATNQKLLSCFRVQPEPLLGLKASRSRGSDLPVTEGSSKLQSQLRKISNYRIWLSDNYDFNIYSYKKLEQKINYINYNAVKHGLVKDPKDWKYSSFRNYEYNDHSLIKIDSIQ